MHKKSLIAAVAAVSLLAGCQWNDLERAGAGAAAGAAIAGVTKGNLLTGALIGAGAGALCDDANIGMCQPGY